MEVSLQVGILGNHEQEKHVSMNSTMEVKFYSIVMSCLENIPLRLYEAINLGLQSRGKNV